MKHMRIFVTASICTLVFGACSKSPTEQPSISQGLRRDYEYPDGAITGERLRALTIEMESEIYANLPEPQRSNMRQEVRRLVEQKLSMVKAVRSEIEKAYGSFSEHRKTHLRTEYEAAMRDITNIEERATYGFAYPDPATRQKTITLMFGIPQITEWRNGMLGWGVAHTVGVWPRVFFTNVVDLSAMRARKITEGDWKGAWELEDGKVFVPGLRFLSEMEISVVTGEEPSKTDAKQERSPSARQQLIEKAKQINRYGPDSPFVESLSDRLDGLLERGFDAEILVGWGLTRDAKPYRLLLIGNQFSFEVLTMEEAAKQGLKEFTTVHIEHRRTTP